MTTRDTRMLGRGRQAAGVVVGGVVGLLAGWALYALGSPVLERSTGVVRELQGALWNAVPALTIVGAAVGWALARRHRR